MLKTFTVIDISKVIVAILAKVLSGLGFMLEIAIIMEMLMLPPVGILSRVLWLKKYHLHNIELHRLVYVAVDACRLDAENCMNCALMNYTGPY